MYLLLDKSLAIVTYISIIVKYYGVDLEVGMYVCICVYMSSLQPKMFISFILVLNGFHIWELLGSVVIGTYYYVKQVALFQK